MTIFQSIKPLKPLLKRRSRKFQTYTKRMPYVDDAIGHVAFVGSERHGFRGQGKVTPSLYFPKFEYAAWKERVSTFFYETPTKFMRAIGAHEDYGLVVILIYNEEWKKNVPDNYFIEFLEARTNTLIYNHPSSAEIMADKQSANRTLTEAGVDMPRIVNDSRP